MPFIIALAALLLITLFFYLVLSKLEKEKTEFFYVLAHRFRSPISIIKWYVELISDKSIGTLNDKQNEYLNEIYKASQNLSDIIDSLLILLLIESGKLSLKTQTTNIKELIDQIIAKQQFSIKRRKLHLEKIYPKDKELVVQADPKILYIILQNLVANAVKYTPQDGNISIKVDADNKNLMLEIQDTGYGIPKKKKSRILANSVSSKDMGFSLYLVKRILRKIRGKISFKSEENKGTTFYITLPIGY